MVNRRAGKTARFRRISGAVQIISFMTSFMTGLLSCQLVFADDERKPIVFNIASQSLAGALTQFAVQSNLTLTYRSQIAKDLQSPGCVEPTGPRRPWAGCLKTP